MFPDGFAFIDELSSELLLSLSSVATSLLFRPILCNMAAFTSDVLSLSALLPFFDVEAVECRGLIR